jgi:hypothetical protein
MKSDFREDRIREGFSGGRLAGLVAKAGMDEESKVKAGAEECRPVQGKWVVEKDSDFLSGAG